MPQLFLPDLLYANGDAHSGLGLLVGSDGRVAAITRPEAVPETTVVRLAGKALFPGLANAHSHTFQRLFRARAEGRIQGGDTFWTWREQMYRAAAFLSPEDMYDVARATFMEMLASGITAVGEFHYVHNDRDGRPYADPNTMALAIVRAAQSVGLRICLLRTAYLRAGYQREPHMGQRRFYENGDAYLRNLDSLLSQTQGDRRFTIGVAPHSIRAVPLDTFQAMAEFAELHNLPLHTHISEQPAENDACVAEYGTTPVDLLAAHGILSRRSVLVHAIHLTEEEFRKVSRTGAGICSCPTTERNLGDGVFPADVAAQWEIPVSFGTDSQAQIDILEDARQTEYHLRLIRRERGILDDIHGAGIGDRLLRSATFSGYRALGMEGGSLAPGDPADFFTADLEDWALLGSEAASLASHAVFALETRAIRDVAVDGLLLLQDGTHPEAEEIRARYQRLQRRFINQEES